VATRLLTPQPRFPVGRAPGAWPGIEPHLVTGASPFPRHWVYDQQGNLAAKSGLADFREWMRTAHGQHSP
jgi:hypothetical protein